MTERDTIALGENAPEAACEKEESKPPRKKRSFFLYVLVLLLGLSSLCLAAGAAMIYWVSWDLPPYTRIADYRLPLVTTVYARDHSVLGYLYDARAYLPA